MSKVDDIDVMALAGIAKLLDESAKPEPEIIDAIHAITKVAIRARGESITVETAATEIRRLTEAPISGIVLDEVEGGS